MHPLLQTFLKRVLTHERREHYKWMTILFSRAAGLLVCTAVSLVISAVGFGTGALLQFFSKKRVPNYVAGVAAAAAVFLVWWMTGWVQIHFANAPAWISVGVSMYLGSVFAAI